MRVREALEAGANLAIILTCALFGTVATVSYLRATGATATTAGQAPVGPATDRPPLYRVGDRITGLSTLDFASSERTLMLVFRSRCRFCTESMPFYRRIHDEIGSRRGDEIRLVGVTTDAVATAAEYLALHRLTLATVVHADPIALRVAGTPTLIVVDRAGRITRLWRGLLSPAEEAGVLADAVGGPAPAVPGSLRVGESSR